MPFESNADIVGLYLRRVLRDYDVAADHLTIHQIPPHPMHLHTYYRVSCHKCREYREHMIADDQGDKHQLGIDKLIETVVDFAGKHQHDGKDLPVPKPEPVKPLSLDTREGRKFR